MKYKLRHYQAEAAKAAIKFIKAKKGNPLIALPTGSGKSLVLAEIVRHIVEEWDGKVLVLSHVKEILEQNHKHIVDYTGFDVALNSSMLGRREFGDITVAGIQSVYRQADRLKNVNVVIIDEAHLVSMVETTMYQKLLLELDVVCVGLTATPFRLGDGYIYGPEKLFTKLVSDWCTAKRFVQLIDEGFLCKLTTKRTELEMDTSDIKLLGGDFNEKQLSTKFDRDSITNEAIKEIIAAGKTRNKWLIFAIDITHAEHIAEVLIRNGIKTAPVHSKMHESGFDRDKSIEGFKDDKYQCVVNVNILTTGFDHPGVDLIALLRPTQSPVLHVQTLGRGSRIQDGKNDCLVLDFAGNTERLGPVNNVLVKIKGKGLEGGDPITKTCPGCQSIIPPAVKFCPDCNHEFVFEHHLSFNAAESVVIENPGGDWVSVFNVEYSLHERFGAPTSVRVDYQISAKQKVSEWVCVEHKNFAKHKADHWVAFRGGDKCNTAAELLAIAPKLDQPIKILAEKKGKHIVVKDMTFLVK